MGASWLDLSNVAGALDGLVGVAGIDQRVEIKNAEAARGKAQALRLTPDEEEEFDRWKGRKPVIVITTDDAIHLINRLRREHAANSKNET